MTWTLLISLLVKSSLVAGAGLACARFLTLRPVDRVDILRGAVCLLLALPVIMNALPPLDLALLPAIAPSSPIAGDTVDLEAASTIERTPWPSAATIIGGLWLLGVLAVTGQLLLGLFTLERWTRQGHPVERRDWLRPLEDLSPEDDRPRLVASPRLTSPLSWGVSPGFIVVDPASLDEGQAARAILAHELAHLRRQDWMFLILSRLALALFWFNPLVWRLHAALAERSEEAADAIALETVDRALYARTLVRLASHAPARLARPATAMAASSRTLKTRIAHIMTANAARPRPLTVALSVVVLAAIATPLAALGVTRQDGVAPPPSAPPAPLTEVAAPPRPPLPPSPPTEAAAPPAPPAPATKHGHVVSYLPEPTKVERRAADQARQDAEQARIEADQARVEADIARRQADQQRIHADDVRRLSDSARAQADLARQAAEGARLAGEQARLSGEQARRIGEQAREQARRQVANARIQMADGAVQMRRGAKQMREEAVRLRDPAYRAEQIAENQARGGLVTDAELLDLAEKLPQRANDLERRADELEARSHQPQL